MNPKTLLLLLLLVPQLAFASCIWKVQITSGETNKVENYAPPNAKNVAMEEPFGLPYRCILEKEKVRKAGNREFAGRNLSCLKRNSDFIMSIPLLILSNTTNATQKSTRLNIIDAKTSKLIFRVDLAAECRKDTSAK